jgi:hypothetical protein
MSEPVTKPGLFSRMLDNPKAVREVRNVLGFFAVVVLAFLVFKFGDHSGAVAAVGCAALMMSAMEAGRRLEMIDLRRRVEALECNNRGGAGTEVKGD